MVWMPIALVPIVRAWAFIESHHFQPGVDVLNECLFAHDLLSTAEWKTGFVTVWAIKTKNYGKNTEWKIRKHEEFHQINVQRLADLLKIVQLHFDFT